MRILEVKGKIPLKLKLESIKLCSDTVKIRM